MKGTAGIRHLESSTASKATRRGVWPTGLTGYTPDIALVMLGTNDVLNNVPTQHSIYSLGGIIDTIRQKNPNVRILLAQIPSTSIPRDNLLALNAAIPGLAAQKSTAQSPVTVVDMYTGFDGVADTQRYPGRRRPPGCEW